MITLYMVTHKDVDFIPKGRTPIYVGNGENQKDFLRDNTGDNIAEKNGSFCELTALYWIWKNDYKSDYIGIEHYRRFFMSSGCLVPTIASPTQMEHQMKKYDGITLKKNKICWSLEEFYRRRHHIEDLNYAEEAIKEYFPEYLDAFHQVMQGNKMMPCNMMVLSRANFDRYCDWLFKILFYVEARTDLSGRTPYQQRAYGFLSERLMLVWFMQNKMRVKSHNTYHIRGSKIKNILSSEKGRFPRTYTPKKSRG